MPKAFVQQDQPPGVPPLELTGERTLPDVPDENYWFCRHLRVYEWIAARSAGRRVVDLACGEGYGTDLLASRAAAAIGVDANPEAHEHARLRYRRANLRFERELIERWRGEIDDVVFLQTIEHVADPEGLLAGISAQLADDGTLYISTPNLLTLAPPGAVKSDNPFHLREYRAEEFAALLERHFGHVALFGLYHARKLRVHELALRLGWDRVHAGLGLTRAFYGWFVPAICSSDFRLQGAEPAALHRALDFVAVCRR